MNVDVKLPLSIDFQSISGIIKAVQVFPDEPELEHMYVVYVNPDELSKVESALAEHPGVNSYERIPMRHLV